MQCGRLGAVCQKRPRVRGVSKHLRPSGGRVAALIRDLLQQVAPAFPGVMISERILQRNRLKAIDRLPVKVNGADEPRYEGGLPDATSRSTDQDVRADSFHAVVGQEPTLGAGDQAFIMGDEVRRVSSDSVRKVQQVFPERRVPSDGGCEPVGEILFERGVIGTRRSEANPVLRTRPQSSALHRIESAAEFLVELHGHCVVESLLHPVCKEPDGLSSSRARNIRRAAQVADDVRVENGER